jgi:hypothetical protein
MKTESFLEVLTVRKILSIDDFLSYVSLYIFPYKAEFEMDVMNNEMVTDLRIPLHI